MPGRPALSARGRFIELAVAVFVLASGLGAVCLCLSARNVLTTEQAARNQDAAALLAERLARSGDVPVDDSTRLAQAFERSAALRLQLSPADGGQALVYRHAASATRAPDWFVRLLPITAAPGWALISMGDRPTATLQLEGQTAATQDALWDLCVQAAAGWLALAFVVGATAYALLRSWRMALAPLLAQAKALERGRLYEIDEPPPAELRLLARSLNRAVQRLRELFAAQARQVAQLQRLAQLDAVTGLPLRRGFIGLLQQRLAGRGGPGAALLLLQVPQLESLNRRIGHEATDRLLGVVGDLLLTYVDRVSGAFAGRLNGSDFALCLPVSGVAAETADSLHAGLAAAAALRTSGTEVLIAGVDGLRDLSAGAALAAADAALARAQAGDRRAIDTQGELVAAAAGARAWREQIAAALAEGRTELDEFPVVDAAGVLIHLECPLRVQLTSGGPFEAAGRWLALARRSRLLPQVDLAVIDLALKASSSDGGARAVRASQTSLSAPEFVAEVVQRLAAAPKAAARLSIECAQGSAEGSDVDLLARASAAWRPWGVRIGVEHASGSPQWLPALQNAGIDYVKVDARNLRGVASDEALRGYAQSLVALIHGLGLAAMAEGIDDPRDLAALWPLGFDGATGPVLGPGTRG